eukprot:scaffold253_cov243-Pinguiococcus_pyrenoidosus.AAC.11
MKWNGETEQWEQNLAPEADEQLGLDAAAVSHVHEVQLEHSTPMSAQESVLLYLQKTVDAANETPDEALWREYCPGGRNRSSRAYSQDKCNKFFGQGFRVASLVIAAFTLLLGSHVVRAAQLQEVVELFFATLKGEVLDPPGSPVPQHAKDAPRHFRQPGRSVSKVLLVGSVHAADEVALVPARLKEGAQSSEQPEAAPKRQGRQSKARLRHMPNAEVQPHAVDNGLVDVLELLGVVPRLRTLVVENAAHGKDPDLAVVFKEPRHKEAQLDERLGVREALQVIQHQDELDTAQIFMLEHRFAVASGHCGRWNCFLLA